MSYFYFKEQSQKAKIWENNLFWILFTRSPKWTKLCLICSKETQILAFFKIKKYITPWCRLQKRYQNLFLAHFRVTFFWGTLQYDPAPSESKWKFGFGVQQQFGTTCPKIVFKTHSTLTGRPDRPFVGTGGRKNDVKQLNYAVEPVDQREKVFAKNFVYSSGICTTIKYGKVCVTRFYSFCIITSRKRLSFKFPRCSITFEYHIFGIQKCIDNV